MEQGCECGPLVKGAVQVHQTLYISIHSSTYVADICRVLLNSRIRPTRNPESFTRLYQSWCRPVHIS